MIYNRKENERMQYFASEINNKQLYLYLSYNAYELDKNTHYVTYTKLMENTNCMLIPHIRYVII